MCRAAVPPLEPDQENREFGNFDHTAGARVVRQPNHLHREFGLSGEPSVSVKERGQRVLCMIN